MGNQDIMQIIMIGILLLCGYLYLFQMVAHRTENKSSIPVIAIILLLIYLAISVPIVFIINSLGSTEMIIAAILLLFACTGLFISLYGLIHNFQKINKGMLALFFVYILAVAYITIFSRVRVRGNSSGAGGVYLLRMDLIQEAIRSHSLEPVNHLLLNVAMFVPFGFLLPLIYPERLAKLSYALLIGLILTTIIEFTQMMLRLGQADLTDVITNTLGAIIGFFLFRLFGLFRAQDHDAE